MANINSKKSFVFALLCGAAFCVPHASFAQQIAPEWSPMDDAPAAAATDGYGDEEASEPRKRRGERAKPRVEITPYIEAQQVAVIDFKNGGDVLTYSTVAAGIDASIQTKRAEGQINARYERLIAYDKGVESQDNISGLARGALHVTRNFSLEAGGIATRSKVDVRGNSPTNLVGNQDNITQVYSVYAGPTFTAQVGELSLNAAYRAGYTKVESKDVFTLPESQRPIDQFDDSISHSATASIGMQPGALPVGWSVGAGYNREDAGQLDGRFENKYVRGDVTVPIAGGLAVVGGIGYEAIKISERDAVRDQDGPFVDGKGRLITDKSSPRLVAYQEDGLIWDVGVMWRPSNRTSVSGYYGQRYGSDTFGANLSYQPNNQWAVNVSVFDKVTSFGNLLNDNLSALPTSFRNARNPLSGDLGTCSFGQSGGSCFNNALQSTNSASFRARGLNAALSSTAGGWDTGVAAGYNRRTYLTSLTGARAELAGLVDQNYFASAYIGKAIDQQSRFDTSVYANYYDPGSVGATDVIGVGANAAYYRQIIRGLSATAAVGVDSYRQKSFDSELTGSALLGLRYSF